MPPRLANLFVIAAAVALLACREETIPGEGDLVEVDATGATIAHEALPGLMDAMTMRFPVRTPSLLVGAEPGTRVRFELVRHGDELVLVAIDPIGMAKRSTPASHDHRPRHGGVVSMIGLLHVEVAAVPTGKIRTYVSDLWRRPLPVKQMTGTIKLNLPDGARTLAFAEVGDVLEARTNPFQAESALANVRLEREGRPLEMNVLLDLTGNRSGAPIVPLTGCVAAGHDAETGRRPRCAIAFGRGFAALTTTPDGSKMIGAVTHAATTVWRLPEATLEMGFEAAPSVRIPQGTHEPDVSTIAVRPDGAEALVTIGHRMVTFDVATGRMRAVHEGPGGMFNAIAWLPDGARVVGATGGGKARLIDATSARVLRTLELEHEALVVAVDGGGRWVAVGTDVGTIGIVDLSTEIPPRVLSPSLQPVAALAFAGGRLLAAGADKTLRAFDSATGAEVARVDVSHPLMRLAVEPGGRRAATTDNERTIRIHALPDLRVVETLRWNRSIVVGLAWGVGPTLVSGDSEGELAVWDMPSQQ